MKKLIIEASLNEAASQSANSNAPFTPDAIVDDALACARTDASIIHFHARNADGSEPNHTNDFHAVIEGIRAGSDLLVHPTLGQFQGGL